MSEEAAVEFLEKVESDEGFAEELASLRQDPPAVLERIRADGFDVESEEVREAFLERYGAELSPEQLNAIAGGVSNEVMNDIAYGFVGAFAVGAAAAGI